MNEKNDLTFREVQKFSLWFRLLVIFMLTVSAGLSVFALRNSKNLIDLVWIVVPIGIIILFSIAKLEIEVRSDGLYVCFCPFHIHFKKFPVEDLGKCYVRTYKPILEYGGWGIRYGIRGKAYNVSGNRGIQLVFKNGRQLLIGSQKPYELAEAVSSIMANN